MKAYIVSLSILSFFLLTSCSMEDEPEEIVKKIKSGYDGVDIVTEVLEGETYRYSLSYPSLENEEADAEVSGYVEKTKSSFLEKADESPESGAMPLVMTFSSNIEKVLDGNYYSFIFTHDYYLGDANGMVHRTAMTLDTKTMEPVEIETLIDEHYLEVLSGLVKKEMREKYEDAVLDEHIDEFTAPVKENFTDFSLTENGIVFTYDKYEWTKGSAGAPMVEVPFEDLEDVMDEEFLKTVAGKERGSIPEEEPAGEEQTGAPGSGDEEAGGVPKKQVALTYDDGPHSEHTTELLRHLDEFDAKATFFLLGSHVESHPSIVKEISASGHEIGNHTWNHPDLTTLEPDQVAKEIQATNEIIYKVTGEKPTVFRPPYGASDDTVGQALTEPEILWTLDTFDWQTESPEEITKVVMSEVTDGSIILLHDIHERSIKASRIILEELKEEGYEFVTVSELIDP
ncbi:polysaccharide deacetylase family protein [Alteribacter keqinensis]|nr:polysaccharide deacetylase family protein [Alteribacter keqinensis]